MVAKSENPDFTHVNKDFSDPRNKNEDSAQRLSNKNKDDT